MKLFRSVKFNVGLFLILVLGAAVGTFLPQLPESPEKVDAFMRAHHAWYNVFQSLGLFDVYHSGWFMGFLALMAFDIVVCKLWNAPPDAGLVNLPPEMDHSELETRLADREKVIRLKHLRSDFSAPAVPEAVLSRFRKYLARSGYHLHPLLGAPQGRCSFIATRHRVQRWGSYLAHVSLVVILAGGLTKLLFGFEEMVPVLEGRSKEVQHKPGWQVYVDKFTVEYYPGTMDPKLFASELRVLDGGKLLGEKRITVNDPLDIHGVRFYQASWGAGGMFRNVTLDLGGKQIVIPQRTPTPLPGTPIRVLADVMLPNFTIGPDGRADTESLDLKNPAVKLHFEMNGHATRPLWLFVNAPQVAFAEDKDGVLSHAGAPPFRLAAIDPILFSGIQVGHDPGYPFVIAGAVAWLIGNVLLFYMHRRRLWVLIHPGTESGQSQVMVGAWSSRGAVGFRREFESMMARVREPFASADRRGRRKAV